MKVICGDRVKCILNRFVCSVACLTADYFSMSKEEEKKTRNHIHMTLMS